MILKTEEKNDKLDFIKIKNFSASKCTIKKMKKKGKKKNKKWEKIFEIHISGMEPASKIYKECLKFNNKDKKFE